MAKSKNRLVELWDEETGVAIVKMIDSYDRIYEGKATCHMEDIDFKSEKVGCSIASMKAHIKSLKGYLNNELRPRLRALNQLYYSMNCSKHYNKRSYESIMLKRQIKIVESDIKSVKEMIFIAEDYLKEYLANNEKVISIIKKRRAIQDAAGGANNEE